MESSSQSVRKPWAGERTDLKKVGGYPGGASVVLGRSVDGETRGEKEKSGRTREASNSLDEMGGEFILPTSISMRIDR